jgi:hypothetical protein
MFGFKLRWIFTNRWVAVAFAVLVCWQAVEFTAPSEDAASDDLTKAQIEQAEAALKSLSQAQ